MTISDSSEALRTLCSRWRSLAWPATAGFLFGYIVLHPVSMVVFQWLDPRLNAELPHGESGGLWGPIAHSFHLSMLPMGLVFGVIWALIATFYACYRLILTEQRDRLAEQTEELKRNNEELARLELANRRTSTLSRKYFRVKLLQFGSCF